MIKESKQHFTPEEFILHNCYKDVIYYNEEFGENGTTVCESEVSPFAFQSYLNYPFVKNNKITAYCPQREKKGYRTVKSCIKPLTDNNWQSFYVKNKKEKEDKTYPQYQIGKRRQKYSSFGCFLSMDKIENKENYKKATANNLDFSADIITSLKSPLNKCFQIEEKEYDKIEYLLKLNLFTDAIKKIESITNFSNNDEIYISIKKFCCIVGTIGNMMPIAEHTNPYIDTDLYYYKIDNIFKKLFMPNENRNFDSNENVCRHYLLFHQLCYKQNLQGFQKFVEDFCLQDYFTDNKFQCIVKPYTKFSPDTNNYYPNEGDIKSWIEWFNINTKLILKRGTRIYLNKKYSKKKADVIYNQVNKKADELAGIKSN